MPVCRICGDDKDTKELTHIPYFRKYKKHAVSWCHECQKLWIQMKKEKIRNAGIFNTDPEKFTVCFE